MSFNARLLFRPVAMLAFCLLGSGMCLPVLAQSGDVPSVHDGIYNEAQAVQGQALYYQHCLGCHGEDMAGVDKAPALAGPQFSSTWNNAPLDVLLARIQTMPPDKPGSLSREQGVQILSYLLWYNGLPLGDSPLGVDAALLSQILFQLALPGQ